ncbi:MAG TPA: Type 1 glutamine amidotransferase-like domain-containing protein [Candidatus Saccharimonadales bacterium]|nr:Type 1 glutamine amidotransferase-like domain-containing protein [Candidatus Saccharimonadales bacterium]
MKRLILMGGRPWMAGEGGELFVNCCFRYFPRRVKLAFCIFAQPESDWNETKQTNVDMFNRFKGQRQITYKTMTADDFVEVSKWADIVYIPGGDPFTLIKKLQPYDLATLWDGKVLAGSSAGADLFCANFAYLQDKTFGAGLGWVPVSCIPHWRDDFNEYTQADWDWVEQASLKERPDVPVLCIPEGEFVEFAVR